MSTTILAVDLGKFNSVLCCYEPPAERRVACVPPVRVLDSHPADCFTDARFAFMALVLQIHRSMESGPENDCRGQSLAEARRCPDCQTQLPAATPDVCPRCASHIPTVAVPTIDQPNTTDASQLTGPFEPADQSAVASRLKFGHYDLLRELGRGGMGVVYQARQKHADRLVALKVMRDGDHVPESNKLRFAAEVRALAHVSHPHIVAVYEVGEENGCPYFTMEYVESYEPGSECRRRCPSDSGGRKPRQLASGSKRSATIIGLANPCRTGCARTRRCRLPSRLG
jgi:hypothetical protein